MIIAFTGNDGSGKTTTCRQAQKFFSDLGFNTKYRHEYDYTMLKLIFWLLGNRRLQESRSEMIIHRKKSVKYVVWPIIVWLDLLFQHLYYRIFERDSVILLDRYPYDHLLSFRYLGVSNTLIEWLYFHFPRAHANIVLSAEPKVAYERKKGSHDYPLQFYERQTQQYLFLAEALGLPVISTDDHFRNSFAKVIETILDNSDIFRIVLKKGIQNRIIFQVFSTCGIGESDLTDRLRFEQHTRQDMYKNSAKSLKDVLEAVEIYDYAIIKTIDDFGFIGNDIDVLVSPTEFSKLMNNLEKMTDIISNLRGVKQNAAHDPGKIDIYLEDALTLDIHSYIGSGKFRFLEFEQLKKFIQTKKIFGTEFNVIDNAANSCIISIHCLEKGFVTLEEYLFLKNNFQKEYIVANFPLLTSSLDIYVSWLERILRNMAYKYPILIPGRILVASRLHLLARCGGLHSVQNFLRDFLLISFWRIRYLVSKRLPYEVPYGVLGSNGTQVAA